VFLGASLAACFDSKRIIFRGEADLPDSGAAGGAGLALPPRSAAAAPGSVAPGADERASGPATITGATPLAADEPVLLDSGVVTGPVDAGELDASP
jgi:hypothetical protein